MSETEGYIGDVAELLWQQKDTCPDAEHIARWDPARVLAECQSKRGLVAMAQKALQGPDGRFWPPRVHMTGMADGLVLSCQVLALSYASHPDYRQEWAP